MALTWTILSATANSEGTQVYVRGYIEGSNTEVPDDPNWETCLIRTINATSMSDCWGYFTASRRLIEPGEINLVQGGLLEWRRTEQTVPGVFRGEFVLILSVGADSVDATLLRQIAINADARSPQIAYPAPNPPTVPGWITLAFHGHSAISGPPSGGTIALDASAVGMLADAADALKLSVDAHAQSLDEDGDAAPNLGAWYDLSNDGLDLTGNPSGDRPDLSEGLNTPPVMAFNAETNPARFDRSSPPAFTQAATIAAFFVPDESEGEFATVVGRYNDDTANRSWRVYYAGEADPKQVVYQAQGSGSPVSAAFDLETEDSKVLFVFRRETPSNGDSAWTAWINGRIAEGVIDADIHAGDGRLYIGARDIGAGWGDAFKNQVNQVALYNTNIDDLQVSLLLHQMARRAGITLGTPIPTELQTQPFASLSASIRNRRPIALINLFSGNYANNRYGQGQNWRQDNQADIEAWLKKRINSAIAACNQFEIMFNRPGGSFKDAIVPSYVFEEGRITQTMWDAFENVWIHFNLTDENDPVGPNLSHLPPFRKRRGWMYVGSGLPLEPDGTITPSGYMGERNVAPATGDVYVDEILSHWADHEDPDHKYRCFMMDNASVWYGMFVQLCHSDAVQEGGWILVGEANPGVEAANLGAPFYASLQAPLAPWWVFDEEEQRHDRRLGYDPHWEASWEERTTYFDVDRGDYPYLYPLAGTGFSNPGDGRNMHLEDIYRWILRGASPVAGHPEVYRKVGAAWDYATNRLPLNRWDRTSRLMRVHR